MKTALRPATPADVEVIKHALYQAATWRGPREGWSAERVLEQEYLRQFWEAWGRPSDVGIVAERNGIALGAAFGRLFTEDHHAHGYVNEATPEIAIGVAPDNRGMGVGSAMLAALAGLARTAGFPALSLSVELDNPAMRLYERTGYVEVDRDEHAARMLLRLD